MDERREPEGERAGAAPPLAALAQIVRATAAHTGQRFFESLVESLSRVLRVRYAFVGVLEPSGLSARTLAFFANGARGADFDYALRGTPCEQVVRRGEVVYFPRNVAALFPEDPPLRAMEVDAYLGAPICGPGDRELGLVVVMHDGPIDTDLEPEAVLQLFAQRAAAELERAGFEEALRRERDFTRGVLETTTTGMIVTDAAGVVRFANAQISRLLGLPREALEGRPADAAAWGVTALDGTPLSLHDLLIGRVLETGAPHPREGRAVRTRASAEPVWIDTSAAPLRDPSGALAHVVASIEDVTALRALEVQYAHAQKMEAVGRLAGGIAHDFNNLLTVILSHAELAQGLAPAGSDLAECIAPIGEAAGRATALTRQLLSFSRKQLIQPAAVDPAALVRGLRPLLSRLLGEKVTVSAAIAPGAWTVRADPGQLEQLLMNLAVNARDAMPDGGHLSLSLENRVAPAGDPLLGPLPPGDYLHLAVRDTGAGMDAATLRQAFEPFFTTKGERGTGLGLATCASVVEQAGGRIAAESRPGDGSTFHVLLPRHAGAAGPSPDAPPAPCAAAAPATVLVLEDDAAVRGTAARVLERAGHRVLPAGTGREALRIAAEHPGRIDLLFSDVVLPDAAGPEIGERLRTLRPDLRVLLVSGHTDDPALRRAAEEGRVALRAKPYTPEALARWVTEALGPARPPAPPPEPAARPLAAPPTAHLR